MIKGAIPRNGSDVSLMVMLGERNIEIKRYVETCLKGSFIVDYLAGKLHILVEVRKSN